MADLVLSRIMRRVRLIHRNVQQGSNGGLRDVAIIDSLIANLRRIENHLSGETFAELFESLTTLQSSITADVPTASYSAQRNSTGSRGRPRIDVSREQLELLFNQGFRAKAMARLLGCSSSFIYRKLRSLGISIRQRFTPISDNDLEQHVRMLHQQHPRAGCEMMRGYLSAASIHVPRHRVRETLNRIDPAAAAQRWSNVIARRTYHVPFPNSLWHIDGYMRLIRWGIVIHGGIDGYSRVITYLNASTDNTALTVLAHFVRASCRYGLPSRVRSDHGGENTMVALLMNLLNGEGRGSHITGLSVHNQRIERLWRDVFTQVIHYYYNLFYSYEDEGLLEPDNAIHKYSLQTVYLPEITERLETFRKAWNNHSMRSEHSHTPNQMWLEGMIGSQQADSTAINNVFGENPYSEDSLEILLAHHGVQLEQLEAEEEVFDQAVVVSRPHIGLNQEQQRTLQDVLTGITDLKDKYVTCCREITTMLSA
ncbi:uncharacterized protein LOC143517696 [Brachyhypopomus gauderio]|uniref:uncharacterized protein LOC143517696 n=1 Tax=Brachyhypopomus gauderio TaxID=698409 RepID=UPI0040415BF9